MVAFSPNGEVMVSASYDIEISLRDSRKHHLLSALRGYTDAVLSVAFSPDDQILVSGSMDSIVCL